MRWGLVFAHPGCEHTAPVTKSAPLFDNRDDAEHAAAMDAALWKDNGYDVTPVDEGWVISNPNDPRVTTKLLVRGVE